MELFHITLLRHGESHGNAAGFIQGQKDYPLTEKGRAQAQALAAFWQLEETQFHRVIASPLSRARETAQTVASGLGLEVECDPAWMERCFGNYEGKNLGEIGQDADPVNLFHPYHPIGQTGESMLDLYLRASQAVQGLLRHPTGHYLVVSHGAILNMAMYAILGLSPLGSYNSPRFRFGNTAYASLTYDPIQHQWALIGFRNPWLTISVGEKES